MPENDNSAPPPTLTEMLVVHRERLCRMVALRMDRRLKGRLDASDVIQEAFFEAAERFDEFQRQPAQSFFLWLRFLTLQQLMIAARRHLTTQARAAGKEVDLVATGAAEISSAGLADIILDSGTSPSEAAARQERATQLQAALETMDANDREILFLRHFEQLTNAETAQTLKIEPAAASQRYFRALKRLREIPEWAKEIEEVFPALQFLEACALGVKGARSNRNGKREYRVDVKKKETRILDTADKTTLRTLPRNGPSPMHWSPAKRHLAWMPTDKEIHLWDDERNTDRPLLEFKARYLKWSDDGRLLAALSESGEIQVCNVETGIRLATVETHDKNVRLAFSPGNDFLVSAGASGKARVWKMPAGISVGEFDIVKLSNSAEDWLASWSPDNRLVALPFDLRSATGKTYRRGEAAVAIP